jgi:hypothetical protein
MLKTKEENLTSSAVKERGFLKSYLHVIFTD